MPQSTTNGWRFGLTVTGATFFMGSSFVAAKILLGHGVLPMPLVAWRFLVAALFALPLVALDEGPFLRALRPRSVRDAAWTAAIGLLQTAAVMSLLFLAMRSIPASTAAILLFSNPIWVAALGPVLLHERLTRAALVGLGVGVLGVALAIGISPGGGASLAGDATALLSAWCWAAATVLRKRAGVRMGAWALSFWQMLVGALAVLAIAWAQGEPLPRWSGAADWGWFLWLAVPASTGSFGLWYAALARGGAIRASGFLFLTPLFTIAISAVLLGIPVGASQVAGGLLVGLALWLINRG